MAERRGMGSGVLVGIAICALAGLGVAFLFVHVSEEQIHQALRTIS